MLIAPGSRSSSYCPAGSVSTSCAPAVAIVRTSSRSISIGIARSCESDDLQIIDHLVHAENEPGVGLRHVFLTLAPRRAVQSHDAIACSDEDLDVVYERVFVKNDLDSVGYIVVVVLLEWDALPSAEPAATPRRP